jgi:hypothetical protein
MEEKIFKLRGKTLAIVDWANVYGWFEKLKWEIDPKKLYDYLKSYPQIFDIRLYFGIDKENPKSIELHHLFKKIGYNLQWKEVKWVPIDLKLFIIKMKMEGLENFLKLLKGREFMKNLTKLKKLFKI